MKNKIKWKCSDTTDFSLLLVDYFEVLRKHIPSRKRKVYIAPELMQKMDTPQYAGWKKRFYEIKEKFEPYWLRGIADVEPVITKDEDIDKLRKAGISTAVQLGEDVYALDMMAADGHNAMDVMYANKICNSLAHNEIEGIFQSCRFEEVSLTYKMHPCFVLTYYNALGARAQWSI